MNFKRNKLKAFYNEEWTTLYGGVYKVKLGRELQVEYLVVLTAPKDTCSMFSLERIRCLRDLDRESTSNS